MSLVPIAFWAFCGGVGYLIADGRGALIGVVAALGLSLVMTAWTQR